MDRQPFTLGGQVYEFGHLSPFKIAIAPLQGEGEPCTLLVTFSHHVFSLKWDGAVHHPSNAIMEEGEKRCFCSQRHLWSADLEQIIRYHVAGKAFESRDGQGVLNHMFYEDPAARPAPYTVYFRLRKATTLPDVNGVLHVISAYENPDVLAKHRLQSIKFARLVGQKVGFPKA